MASRASTERKIYVYFKNKGVVRRETIVLFKKAKSGILKSDAAIGEEF